MFGLNSIWHWVILLVIVVLIFGTKKLTGSGKDMGTAVREFKKALHGEDDKDKTESLKADGNDEHAETHQSSKASDNHKDESN